MNESISGSKIIGYVIGFMHIEYISPIYLVIQLDRPARQVAAHNVIATWDSGGRKRKRERWPAAEASPQEQCVHTLLGAAPVRLNMKTKSESASYLLCFLNPDGIALESRHGY
nr:uncharacterized protein LOC108079318 [Drosophila kikkawai]